MEEKKDLAQEYAAARIRCRKIARQAYRKRNVIFRK